jgi:(p)ppGpp synthase/HD superfamily hydrolase
LFEDKKDKEGKPYINQLIRVSTKLDNHNTKVAGLLHDTLEDTNYTEKDLKKLKFSKETIELVKLVTNKKDQKYHDKITSIIDSNNIEAIKLKYSDMSDNYNPTRMKDLCLFQKIKYKKKYAKEIIRLEEYLKQNKER